MKSGTPTSAVMMPIGSTRPLMSVLLRIDAPDSMIAPASMPPGR